MNWKHHFSEISMIMDTVIGRKCLTHYSLQFTELRLSTIQLVDEVLGVGPRIQRGKAA